MAMFQFDLAFMLEVIAFAAGLVLIHFGRSGAALLLRVAGTVLVVAAVGTAACSIYYAIRYHVQGGFDYAHGHAGGCPMMDHPGGGMMHGGPMMGGPTMMHRYGPMMPGMRGMPVPPPPGAAPETTAPAPDAKPEETPKE